MDLIRKDKNLRTIKFYSTFIGIWTLPSHPRLYSLWTVICLTFNVLYVAALIIQFVLSLNIIDLYINLAEVAMLTKMVNILWNRIRIQKLLNRIHYDPEFYVDDSEAGELAIVTKQMKSFSNFGTVYFLMSLSAVTISTGNGFGDPPTMAFAAWYPFGMTDMSVPWKFWVVFVYQTFPMISHACINVTWDNLFMYLLANVQIQLELLNHRLDEQFKSVSQDNGKKLKKIFRRFSAVMT